jgi:hypothetical protein
MAQGITLRFQRDAVGRPLVMYLCDTLAVCPVCGHEVIQRRYPETPYHTLTMARLRALLLEIPVGFRQACEQCGEPLAATSVARSALTYGFPLGDGLIQGFGRRAERAFEHHFALWPHRRFDVQMQPEWEASDDQSVGLVPEPTDDDVLGLLGRRLSLKGGWRCLLKQYLERSAQASVEIAELATDCLAIVGPNAAQVERRWRELIDTRRTDPDGWVVFRLDDIAGELLDYGPHNWLPGRWYADLRTGRLAAAGAADVSFTASMLREAVEAMPVPTRLAIDDDYDVDLALPVEESRWRSSHVSLRQLVLEALATGAAPEDRLRLWLDDVIAEAALSDVALDRVGLPSQPLQAESGDPTDDT